MAEQLDYAEFGRRFVRTVVTPERVQHTVMSAAGGDMSTTVRLAGGIVSAKGSGGATHVDVEVISEEPLCYRATVHATLAVNVRIARVPNRYEGEIRIPLVLTASAYDDMTLVIEIADIWAEDVELELRPLGAAAAVVERIGEVSEQVKREITKLVNVRKDSPDLDQLRRLELTSTIEEEWQRRVNR